MQNRMQYTARKPQEANGAQFDAFISRLADTVMKQYEKPLLAKILKRDEDSVKPYRIREMLWQLPSLAADKSLGEEKRKNAIKQDLTTYFREYESASLDGLVLFRLKKYRLMLERVAEQLMEQYRTQREYDEFVHLLRYFVSVQSGRPLFLHLMIDEKGKYTLLDEKMNDITSLCMAEFVPIGEFVSDSMDDLLISILITVAPERLIIHGAEYIRNQELFETVGKVFDKIEYCTGCPTCKKEEV